MIEDKVEIAKRRGVDRRAADAHLRAHATRFPSLLERPRTAPSMRKRPTDPPGEFSRPGFADSRYSSGVETI
jgi:hypothetical protein